jgi:hypothetical protein
VLFDSFCTAQLHYFVPGGGMNMARDIHPRAANWYENLELGRVFQVLSVNKDEGTVDVQQSDGDLEELSLEEWYGMDLEPVEPPEDWSGPYDDLEKDDMGYTEL